MAARSLRLFVHVLNPKTGSTEAFGPGDEVPAWAVKVITNPDVWDDDEPAPAPVKRSSRAKAPAAVATPPVESGAIGKPQPGEAFEAETAGSDEE